MLKDGAALSRAHAVIMTTLLALLRGINVGGYKQVAMADLRGLLTKLGFVEVQSLLQSGNLAFRDDARTTAELERMLETETEKRIKLQTTFFVRTAVEWKAVIARNPFPQEARRDPGHLIVMFLKDVADRKRVDVLRAAITGPELVRADGRHAYIVYPNGVGRSRLTHTLIEKKLGTRGTGRNWNTVLKLDALADERARVDS